MITFSEKSIIHIKINLFKKNYVPLHGGPTATTLGTYLLLPFSLWGQ